VVIETPLPKGTTDEVMGRMFPEPDPYADDPVAWITGRMSEFPWSKQREIAESVSANRYTAVQSCHSTGKSFTASRLMSWWIDAHPPGEAFVVSTAPSQTQVEAILWREVGRAHRKGELVGRITYGQVPSWKLGQEIVGFGRKPADLTSKEEAMATFQGIHAKYVLVVIDEAGGVPRWLFDAVDTLVTNDEARVLAIGNPDDPASHFVNRVCSPGSGWNKIQIGYQDTPAFTGEEVPEELLQLLISETWVSERRKRWGEGSPLFTSKVLGLPPDISDDTLISPALIKAAQERDLSAESLVPGQYGLDVARFGADETVLYRDRGGRVRLVESWPKQDTMETTGHLARHLNKHGGAVAAQVDVDGLGAGVVDRGNELGLPIYSFSFGSSPIDKERFLNKRAEAYWNLREDFEVGSVDLAPDGEDDDLAAQLGSIKWTVTSKGKIKIESKDDMRARGLPSPDRADAVVMARYRGLAWTPPPPSSAGREAKSETADLMKRNW